MFQKLTIALMILGGLAACTPTTGGGYTAGCCETGGGGNNLTVNMAPESGATNPSAGQSAPVATVEMRAPTPTEVAAAAADGMNPVAGVATGAYAGLLSDLGATTNPDGTVTVYEADMTGSDPGGL